MLFFFPNLKSSILNIFSLELTRTGSNDGGATVHKDVEEFNSKMKFIGERLNLRGHTVAGMTNMYGPGDIGLLLFLKKNYSIP